MYSSQTYNNCTYYGKKKNQIMIYVLTDHLRLCLPWEIAGCVPLKFLLGESIDPLIEALADSGTMSNGNDSIKHAVLIRVLSSSP